MKPSSALRMLTCVFGCHLMVDAMQTRAPTFRKTAPLAAPRLPPITCQADTDGKKNNEVGFAGGFGAAAGLFANPISLCSLYTVASTGSGLPTGPFGLLGALEGISFLVVAGIVLAALASKATKGSGLPAGPLGLLGLSEGLSFLSLLLAVIIFPAREFNIVGNPETAIVNVPEVAAQFTAVVAPIAASLFGAVQDTVSSAKLPENLPDVSSIKLPEGMSSFKLPEGMPDVSSFKLPEVSLPEGLPSMPTLEPPDATLEIKTAE